MTGGDDATEVTRKFWRAKHFAASFYSSLLSGYAAKAAAFFASSLR